MSDFQFDEETTTEFRRKIQPRKNLTARILRAVSFGVIKTPKQIKLAQIVFLLLSAIYIFLMLYDEEEEGLQPPSQELINAEQPINP